MFHLQESLETQISTLQASKSKPSTVETATSQRSREGEILKAKLPVTAAQVLPSAQESSPASEVVQCANDFFCFQVVDFQAKPSWLEELSRKQANRRSGVFPEKQQPPPVKPADQEQAFRRSGGIVQEEASRRSLMGGGAGFPEKPASKPEPPLAENKPNLPSRPSQVTQIFLCETRSIPLFSGENQVHFSVFSGES